MGTTLIDNFDYRAGRFLDSRQSVATLAALRATAETSVPAGFRAYCAETSLWYEFNPTNTPDPSTGRWRAVPNADSVTEEIKRTITSEITDEEYTVPSNKAVKEGMDAIGEMVDEVSNKIVRLEGIGNNWQSVKLTGWEVGQKMYNSTENELRECLIVSDTGGVSKWKTPNPTLSKDAFYLIDRKVYLWDGENMCLTDDISNLQDDISNDSKEKDVVFNNIVIPGEELEYIEKKEGCYITADGSFGSNSLWNSYKYDVEGLGIVFVTANSVSTGALCALYDAEDNVIQVIDYGLGMHISDRRVVVTDAKYIVINQHSVNTYCCKKYVISYDKRINLNNLKDKTVAFLGDSITAGSNELKGYLYHDIFAKKYECINKNLGIWSTCIANNTTNTDGKPDTDLTSPKYHRFVLRVTAENLADCSLIVVFGGTNDYTYDSKPIGELFDIKDITPSGASGDKEYSAPTDTDTFAGALHELINAIREVAPHTPMVFITPLLRDRSGVISRKCNKWGDSIRDFAEAIIKICGFYSIPVLDAEAISQLDFTNSVIAEKYSSDGLHPNILGHEILGNLLYRFVENNVIIS